MTIVVDPRTASIAVIGVGSRYRHDDGVGRVVADRIGALGLAGVQVNRCDGDPAELMDALSGPPWAVLVGVISAHTPCPGRLHRIDIGARSLTPPVRTSQYGLGVLDAVAPGPRAGPAARPPVAARRGSRRPDPGRRFLPPGRGGPARPGRPDPCQPRRARRHSGIAVRRIESQCDSRSTCDPRRPTRKSRSAPRSACNTCSM